MVGSSRTESQHLIGGKTKIQKNGQGSTLGPGSVSLYMSRKQILYPQQAHCTQIEGMVALQRVMKKK
eukprot:scaffold48267_cov20-Tisochrysis_lutea.AAC.2